MACYSGGKEVGAVNIYTPELSHPVDWVRDCLKVLGETGRGHEVVDLAVLADDLRNGCIDRLGV